MEIKCIHKSGRGLLLLMVPGDRVFRREETGRDKF